MGDGDRREQLACPGAGLADRHDERGEQGGPGQFDGQVLVVVGVGERGFGGVDGKSQLDGDDR